MSKGHFVSMGISMGLMSIAAAIVAGAYIVRKSQSLAQEHVHTEHAKENMVSEGGPVYQEAAAYA